MKDKAKQTVSDYIKARRAADSAKAKADALERQVIELVRAEPARKLELNGAELTLAIGETTVEVLTLEQARDLITQVSDWDGKSILALPGSRVSLRLKDNKKAAKKGA